MSEWKECKLADVAEKFAMGPFGSNIKAENFVDSGVPVIRGTNLNYYKYVDGKFVFLTEDKADQLRSSNCFPGDLVFTHRGTLGQVGIIPESKYTRYVISQSGMKVTVNSKLVDNHFLFYFFRSDIGQHELLQHESQVGVPSISNPLTSLKSVSLKLPPFPEQRAIASVLSSLDDKIDLLHRQNKTLEAMAETLFRQWFVVETVSNKITTLGEFAQNIRQNVKVEDLGKFNNYVGLEHIPKKCITLSGWGKPGDLESNKSIFCKNDILFGKLRSYFHKVVFTPIDGVCSTDILVLRPKKEEWFSFCLFWFFSKDVVEHSDLGSGGTRMPRTNWEILSSFQIPKPDLKTIAEYDKIIRPMINKMSFNIFQIQNLENLRNTLLPKLMSGEVRVAL
ncbi:MAG: restriction endonuclease subunit S [Chitinivibrionales bacterium]|nr:restriction endonuclease subunit S [Chitinivibrionales bacterium]